MSLSPADFSYVTEMVRQRSAIDLQPGKEYLVESRLAPIALENVSAFGNFALPLLAWLLALVTAWLATDRLVLRWLDYLRRIAGPIDRDAIFRSWIPAGLRLSGNRIGGTKLFANGIAQPPLQEERRRAQRELVQRAGLERSAAHA